MEKEELTMRSLGYHEVRNAENQPFTVEEKLKLFSVAEDCPVRNVLDRIGDKWSMLVLLILEEAEVLRFNEIHKHIKTISQKMLSATLKVLEADDLVTREIFPEIPPRVEYRLTQRGRSLMPHLRALVDWANENFDDIKSAREKFGQR